MKRVFVKFLSAYLSLLLAFVLLKPAFMLAYASVYSGAQARSLVAAMWHGLPMDMCMAAYFTIIPALLVFARCFVDARRAFRIIESVYYGFSALVIAGIAALDLELYGHWGFRLDATPLFYFISSPSSAMASATAGEIVAGVATWLVGSASFYALFYYLAVHTPGPVASRSGRVWRAMLSLVLTGMLFLPIRGGFTVSTMNLSRAYFSEDMRLNHAAINPAFSLMYSLTHRDDFGSQMRFFSDEDAASLTAGMIAVECGTDSCAQWLDTQRPDIYLVILESFSSHLMPSLGGEDIAPRLDSLAREGILFDNAYASSFRTDRALPAILSALPAQPTESLMKHVSKAEKLPCIASELRDAGYECGYYYGGDANFTNMLAYLRAGGFSTVVSDKDFPMSMRASKWGAPDHAVFERALNDARTAGAAPRFSVVQTSSSHEPFDVPYDNPRLAPGPKRAFAYTDSCLGAFVDSLRVLPSWKRALLVIVPDHYGCYPDPPEAMEQRHSIPIVLAGGALKRGGKRVSRLASQTDIAATLLGQLGLDSDRFVFSRNMAADSCGSDFVFFSEPEQAMMIMPGDSALLNVATSSVHSTEPTSARMCKAYLQRLYNYIDSL